MAIYHCSVKTIGRSNGSSIVNSAAYRSGEKLYDERLAKSFNYPKKSQDIMHKEIIAPDNVPEWVHNREKLWNQVEFCEKRRDSQLAREVEISLPREFTTDQNISLVRDYIKKEFVNRGMIADVCMHYGKRGNEYNPHAHVLLTMRDINEKGFGLKNTSWNSKELLISWRESWAEFTNKHLSLNGFEVKVDHRSLEAQGINLTPHNVELPNDAKKRLTDQKERQLAIMRENGERLAKNPEIALDMITRSKATFSDKDISRYLHSRTADEAQFQEVYTKIKAHEDLVILVEKDGKYLYTTKEILNIERGMFKDVSYKSSRGNFRVSNFKVKEVLSLEQATAVEYLCQNKDFRAVVGFAGTGKTYMLSEAREIWESNGYNVKGATLSGIAAQGLSDGAGIESTTVARRLIDWENDRDRLTKKDILVIDEAGMLGTKDVARIMIEARSGGAKVVMLGDPQQLQAIEAGAAFRGIVEREGALEMNDIRRQDVDWQREATHHLAMGKAEKALDLYRENHQVYKCNSTDNAIDMMIQNWSLERCQDETSVMLAYRRCDVGDLNIKAREVLKHKGEIEQGEKFELQNGIRELSKKDQVYFLRNNNELGVKNGTLGEVKSITEDGDIVVNVKESACDRDVSFNVRDYNHLDHGYATTIHKSQGTTVDRSYVLATRGFNQHIAYVAMSRHCKDMQMFWSKSDFKGFSDLKFHLSREARKDNALDYVSTAKDFANNRGLLGAYKDILVRGNELFNQVKDIFHDITDKVKSKLVFVELEERRKLNQGIRHLSEKYECGIDKEIKWGEKFKMFATERIAEKNYVLMRDEDASVIKIAPFNKCQDVIVGSEVEVYKTQNQELIIAPSVAELWSRKVNDISEEFEKSVTRDVAHGDVGICRGIFKLRDAEYAIMEKLDTVSLVNKENCFSKIKEGDCMRVQVKPAKDFWEEDNVRVVHDIKMEKQLVKELEMEKSRDIGMSLSL